MIKTWIAKQQLKKAKVFTFDELRKELLKK